MKDKIIEKIKSPKYWYFITTLYVIFLLVGFFYQFGVYLSLSNEEYAYQYFSTITLFNYWQITNPDLSGVKMYVLLLFMLILAILLDKLLTPKLISLLIVKNKKIKNKEKELEEREKILKEKEKKLIEGEVKEYENK